MRYTQEKLDLGKSFDKLKTLTMQTLTIEAQVSTTVDKTIEIPVPSFFRTKDEQNWLALLDENNVVRFTVISDYVNLSRGGMDTFKRDVIQAWQTYHGITEAEFLAKYDEIMESMHPTLKP